MNFPPSITRSNRTIHKWMILLAGLGLAVRIVFVLATQHIGGPTSMDGGTYHSIALNLLQGKGYSEDGQNPSIFVAPLFPLLLFISYKIFGVHPLLVELLQCVFGLGSAYLSYLIARRFFSPLASLVAFGGVLFFPDLLVISTFLYTESLFLLLFLAAIWTVLRLIEQPTWRNIVLAGLLGGLATLSRGVTLFFPLLLVLALKAKYNWSRTLQTVLLYTMLFFVPILPWALRNYQTFHAVVPVAVGTGDVLWTGNYLPFDGKYNYEKTMDIMDSLTVGLNQVDRDKLLIQEAKENMRAEPLRTVVLMVRKFFRFWVWVYEATPSGEKRETNNMVQLILMISYYPVLIGFVAGLYHFRHRWREMVFLFLLLGYYAGIHAVMLVTPRYRIPLLPAMIIIAAAFFTQFFERKTEIHSE